MPSKDGNPRCGALTADNKKCKNHAAGQGKYCAQHKGWRPDKKQKKMLAR